MASTPRTSLGRKVDYPTSDGKPMAETEAHRKLMTDLIETLEAHFADEPMVCVSGNLMMFYEEGNKRKHISPDVFVVRGIPKRLRLYYLTWEEGKGPDVAIELTSKSTKSEDVKKKMALYRDVLKISEYFLFDPFSDYLKPPMQGYRLVEGRYERIEPVDGRLPSAVLGLHLERDGTQLRLFKPNDPGHRLPTPREVIQAERARAEVESARAEVESARAEAESARAEAESARAEQAEAEVARLLREIEALRRQGSGGG